MMDNNTAKRKDEVGSKLGEKGKHKAKRIEVAVQRKEPQAQTVPNTDVPKYEGIRATASNYTKPRASAGMRN